MKTQTVPVHAPNCNDYTGCQDGCTNVPRDKAVFRNGAWRVAK